MIGGGEAHPLAPGGPCSLDPTSLPSCARGYRLKKKGALVEDIGFLKTYIKKTPLKVTFNKDFEEVIESCSNIKRLGQNGTWITNGLKESFIKLHEKGLAISVEVWEKSQIVGGLYGLDLGDIFCGESMFSKSTNSSKIALVYLAEELKKNNYRFIDCQIPTEHLKSMGGEEISRDEFLKLII